LSTGLLKIGDPIYLVKWETSAAEPTLLHIQSIPDVELFGINASNYGALVNDRAALERRINLNVDTLQRDTLVPAVPPTPTPTPAVTATPTITLRARDVEVRRTGGRDNSRSVVNLIEITGAAPRTRVMASLEFEEYICSPECTDTYRGNWGPIEIGVADNNGRLNYTDRHSAYKKYKYTFTNVTEQNRATLEYGDDL
jgi:hypothetical protein